MAKVLFIAAHRPDRSPSQRYRFEQFVPFWKEQGFEVEYAWMIDEDDDRHFYSPGRLAAKARIFLKSWNRRQAQVEKAKGFDLLVLQREAFMTGSTRFERAFAATGLPLIYDFDDAIWHLDMSEGNRKLHWLKDPGKTAKIIRLADHVIAGNEFLAQHAKQYNASVEVIPTVVDTDRYLPVVAAPIGPVVIGWTGSHTSMAHLYQLLPVLHAIHEQWGDGVRFRIISDRNFVAEGLPIENIPWNSASEPEDLAGIHIGIMPLPDDMWSRGKCGFKGLQYMALGKAVVLGRVGANTTIIQEGVNGLLASGNDEWIEKLGQLISDADLRLHLGQAARKTVEDHYSVKAWRQRYVDLFTAMIQAPKRRHKS